MGGELLPVEPQSHAEALRPVGHEELVHAAGHDEDGRRVVHGLEEASESAVGDEELDILVTENILLRLGWMDCISDNPDVLTKFQNLDVLT